MDLYASFIILRSCQYEKRYYISHNPEFLRSMSSKKLWKYRNSSFLPLRLLCIILYHPVIHYVFHGVYEGADLVETFNSEYYLDKYSDVLKSGMNPYCEYLCHGRHEGRSTTPHFLSHIEFLTHISSDYVEKSSTNRYKDILSLVEQSQSYVLVFEHGVGGGSGEYINKTLIPKLNNEFEYIAVVMPNRSKKTIGFELVLTCNDIKTKIYIPKPSDILAFNPNKIIINNIAYYKRNLLDNVFQLIESYSGELEVFFHDFYALCPSVVLMEKNLYCDLKNCDNCSVIKKEKLERWRCDWQKLFDKAKRVTFFSNSSKKIADRVFKFSDNYIIQPHRPLVSFKTSDKYQYSGSKPLTVAFIGAVNMIKGADIILKMAENNPDVDFILIGYVVNEYQARVAKCKNIKVTGAYKQIELPSLLKENNVKIAVVASVVPETFCYVLQELMMLEYPVVSFDIGAQGERISQYKYGELVREITADSMFVGINRLHQKLGEFYE